MSLLLWVTLLGCGEPTVDAVPTEAEIAALIERLVSPNPAPAIRGPSAVYPKGFDRAAQEPVFAAWMRLFEIGLPAFPQLIARCDDTRYSFTVQTSGDLNYTVGDGCWMIVERHLQPFGLWVVGDGDPRGTQRRPRYVDAFELNKPKKFTRWWKARRGRSLRELQIEVLEWTISQELLDPKAYPPDEVAYLQKKLADLRASKAPLRPGLPFSK